MTTLSGEDFRSFFRAVNDGREPFAWQSRLLTHLLREAAWPDRIDAPTGSGKSSVVDVHVFAVAVSTGDKSRLVRALPRRLVVTVDRRALVDGHADRANRLASLLMSAEEDPAAPSVVREVADRLMRLRASRGPDGARPFDVAILRGGVAPSREWLDSPTACQVIAATPDMWGSRLLFNGYGSSKYAHPREAGLLAIDAAVVLDEAHLNRQLLITARRVRDLTRVEAGRLGLPALQVTAMSATPFGGEESSVGVRGDDLGHDPVLSDRLCRPKPVSVRESEDWPATRISVGRVADAIVEEVQSVLAVTEGTVGCVVNTVRLATEVSARLARAKVPDGVRAARAGLTPEVRQIVGRMRPWDLERLRAEHPKLFSLGGDPSIDVVVATQTIEVGVDMDLSALVTELAPGSALAQRAGRVNRSGTRGAGPVTVIVPADRAALDKTTLPYETDELRDALHWVERRAQDPAGLAPWAIHPPAGGDGPPGAALRRIALQRVEPWNVQAWAATSETQFAEHDLELWLSDDLSRDLSASVVVRQGLPVDLACASNLLRAAPPQGHELFPVRLDELRELVADVAAPNEPKLRRLFIVRSDGITAAEGPDLADLRLRPEDVVVLDPDARVFRSQVVNVGGDEQMDDVSERASVRAVAERTVRFHAGAPVLGDDLDSDALLSELRQLAGTEKSTGDQSPSVVDSRANLREFLARWARPGEIASTPSRSPADESKSLLGALLSLDGRDAADIVVADEADPDFWLVVTGTLSRRADEEARQTWTPRVEPVDLDVHRHAVGLSAGDLGLRLGLPDDVCAALEQAGELHDEGKTDPRFQRALRNRPDDHAGRVLAKSGMRSLQRIRRAREESGLPSGWRHEQLSAALAWERLGPGDAAARDLAVRLVGTSHGHGRTAFAHAAQELVPAHADFRGVSALFGDYEWDLLIERSHGAWGYWACAYLEALLRAADGSVSRRGS
jgi:CRISPR-associated endonuclease/helicase Cas3